MRTSKNKTKANMNASAKNTTANMHLSKGRKKSRTQKRKRKEKIFKGGNNPFSDIFGMWGTMTYNLSNAFSGFTITPPTGYMNQSSAVSNPSPSKQFV
jgi:hypothetical protein